MSVISESFQRMMSLNDNNSEQDRCNISYMNISDAQSETITK